jgi:outer membrane protein assembly factor BamD
LPVYLDPADVKIFPMRTMPRLAVAVALSLPVFLGSCALFTQSPEVLLPAPDLYEKGSDALGRNRNQEARVSFQKIVERHPDSSFAPLARFLLGEAYYRDAEFDKAIKEFEAFMAFYPRHLIADLVQYRLAMSYYDQLKPVEQDQGLTVKALEHFKTLVKEYPESRYATDGLAKIDICRFRLAQKELWVADYYSKLRNTTAARQRLEIILREYPETLVVPETLFLLAEIQRQEGEPQEASRTLRRLAEEYSHTEWGRRASQRLGRTGQR